MSFMRTPLSSESAPKRLTGTRRQSNSRAARSIHVPRPLGERVQLSICGRN